MPRSEYPRPQFVRPRWLCLNGEWQFEVDHADTGLERGLAQRELTGRITVPFCPESPLSGVGNVDFMNAVWYRREAAIPADWAPHHVLLHFQAVDYDATIWVNGKEVARHRGGFSPIECDLAGVASPGETAAIVVRARDLKDRAKPGGKQSRQYANHGCHYTRTTGIWQTVWMEPVPAVRLKRPRITPDVAGGCFRVQTPITNSRPGAQVRCTLSDGEGEVVTVTAPADSDFTPRVDLPIPEARRRYWGPGAPNLYDLSIELLDAAGAVVDQADSYAGLRSVTVDGKAVKINGRSVFQRLVLDQGYYPDGIMTAPNDQALRADIELSLAAGFNGARLHQKVFEERFLYHADQLGYLVWGEFGDWGIDRGDPKASYLTQWLEVLGRDYNHPSIVGWCPLNETAEAITDRITGLDDLTRGMYLATKAMDTTRPVLDTSGYSHRVGDLDIYDSHDYDQDPATFQARHDQLADGNPHVNRRGEQAISRPYAGEPYFVSEFGGIWWNPRAAEDEYSWGYGNRPKSVEEFHDRFDKLCAALLGNPDMFAYCYTQLTDVYQEQNGIYTFDRGEKFDLARIRASQQRPAAIESD
jgi:beta-galactosidase/beta-glucuronidase